LARAPSRGPSPHVCCGCNETSRAQPIARRAVAPRGSIGRALRGDEGALAIAAALFAIGPVFWPRHWVEAVGSWLSATVVVAAALAWALRREAAADQAR
jgi:hypothetical protein